VHAEFDHKTSGSGEPGLICHGTVVDKEADDDDDDESNAADDVIANAIANPFDNNAMCELASHNVNWQPSRRVLLCCGERGHTKHARKVKVHFSLKKRKKYGDDKFLAYVHRRAQKAMRVALALSTSSDSAITDHDAVMAATAQVEQVHPDDASVCSDVNRSDSQSDAGS
jgi:hypothetical protein